MTPEAGGCSDLPPVLLRYAAVFAISALALGYDLGIISVAKNKVKDYYELSDTEVEVMVGLLNLISALGGLLGGLVADKAGRRKALFLASCLELVGSVIMAVPPKNTENTGDPDSNARGYAILLFGRAVTGLGIGAALMYS